MKKWEQSQEQQAKKAQSEQAAKVTEKVNKFEKIEMTVPEADKSQIANDKLGMLEPDQRDKLQYIEKMIADKHKITTLEDERQEEKKEWLKVSFWAPDNTPAVKEDAPSSQPPSVKMYCPAVATDDHAGKHSIKLKELITLKLDERVNDSSSEYACWIC